MPSVTVDAILFCIGLDYSRPLSARPQLYRRDSWARRLLDTRAITIVPAANALGYAQEPPRREENGIDPNRDFAWDQMYPANSGVRPDTVPICMRTVAARSINELWREHVFQVPSSLPRACPAPAPRTRAARALRRHHALPTPGRPWPRLHRPGRRTRRVHLVREGGGGRERCAVATTGVPPGAGATPVTHERARPGRRVTPYHWAQLSITFHGGDSLIAYTWGDTLHCGGWNHIGSYCSGADSWQVRAHRLRRLHACPRRARYSYC